MNTRTVIATALIALAGAGSAFAQEGTQDFRDLSSLSTQGRAEVRADLLNAQHAGVIPSGDASFAPAPDSTLTRTRVVAELHEAQRLGVADASNEGEFRIATPAEQAAIHLAGERAVAEQMASAAR